MIASGSSGILLTDLTTGSSLVSSLPSGSSIFSVAELNQNTLLLGTNNGHVYELNQSGQISLFASVASGNQVESIQADTNGNVFVTTTSNSTGAWQSTIGEYSSTGTLTRTISSNVNEVFTALSPYEGMIYGVYGSATPGILAINVSTGASSILPGATSSTGPQSIAVEPNGNLFVTSGSTSYLVNPSTGAVLSQSSTITTQMDGNLAINATGSSVYGTTFSNVYQYSTSGNLQNTYTPPTGQFYYDVAVIGGQNAIVAAPEPASAVLLLGMLGMLALVKRKHA